jgi:hypothetical protein
VTLAVNADGSVAINGTTAGRVIEATGVGKVMALGDLAFDAQSPIVPVPNATNFVATLVATAPAPPQAHVYVPVIADTNDPSIPSRVIGFGLADIPASENEQFQLIKRENRIAVSNASPILVHALDPTIFADTASDSKLAELLSQHSSLPSPLFAPALVR